MGFGDQAEEAEDEKHGTEGHEAVEVEGSIFNHEKPSLGLKGKKEKRKQKGDPLGENVPPTNAPSHEKPSSKHAYHIDGVLP